MNLFYFVLILVLSVHVFHVISDVDIPPEDSSEFETIPNSEEEASDTTPSSSTTEAPTTTQSQGYPPDESEEDEPECYSTSDCLQNKVCVEKKCISKCMIWGRNARCSFFFNKPICYCPFGYVGNPYKSCLSFMPKKW